MLKKSRKLTPPCVNGVGPLSFLNDPNIKKALHVDVNTNFEMCNDTINEKYVREGGSYQYYYPLIEAGYKIFVYSGDADGAVPITGTL